MTFVVPFGGSELAVTALVRAVEFGTVLDERIMAVSVIPEGNARTPGSAGGSTRTSRSTARRW